MGNIALNKPVTANNSILPYVPSRAVDAALAPSNRWVSDSVPATLTVDPQAKYLVNRWVVKHPPMAGWQAANYANSDYKLQGSNDNANWSDIAIVANNSANSTDQQFYPVAYRYYRIYVSKGLRCNSQTTSIVEFELYQAFSPNLTNLTISAGTLTPAFMSDTLAYTATVSPEIASINVTPTAQDPQAIIKINGTTVVSGQPYALALGFGTTTITINVTDQSGAQKNYTIVVTRPGSSLSSLTVQTTSGINIPLNPTFVSGIQAYTATVANDVQKVTFTPTAQKSTANITIKGETVANGVVSKAFDVVVGVNQIPIVVTADGASFTYTLTITRSAGVNLLLDHVVFNFTARGIPPGTDTVTMIDSQTKYPVNVLTSFTAVTVTPYARDTSVQIKVNNLTVPSGSTSISIALLTTGTTIVTIVVSSPDGATSRTYTFELWKVSI